MIGLWLIAVNLPFSESEVKSIHILSSSFTDRITGDAKYLLWWKGKRFVFIVQISPEGTADFTLFTSRYWNSLFHSLIHLGRMQCIFCSCKPFAQYQFLLHLVPIIAGWTETVWIQNLPKAFYTWPTLQESNPRPLDLGSNALTIRPCTSCTLIGWAAGWHFWMLTGEYHFWY